MIVRYDCVDHNSNHTAAQGTHVHVANEVSNNELFQGTFNALN